MVNVTSFPIIVSMVTSRQLWMGGEGNSYIKTTGTSEILKGNLPTPEMYRLS